MGFPEALRQVLKGKTVARSTWSAGCRVKIRNGKIQYRAGHKGSEWANFWASNDDMLALDWQVITL